MRLPDTLQAAIERECALFSPDELKKAAAHLTSQYQEGAPSAFQSPAARAAYLAVRMPATYAAIYAALLECSKSLTPTTCLDLGAGPGTGSWVAAALFPSLTSLTLIEQSCSMAEIGQRLASASLSPLLKNATWHAQSLQQLLPPADLALLSYLVAELSSSQTLQLLDRLWPQTQTIVVIEPGTPAGYRRILEIRDWALESDAHLIAPCPHCQTCPLQSPDWCHFPARVERTRLHKLLKHASLGYEDEKFSYLAFSKTPAATPLGRIVGPPKKGSGLVQFPLCTQGQLLPQTIARSHESYHSARHASWGDAWM